eukprot:5852076-Pyramimonas_sp.AAC.2
MITTSSPGGITLRAAFCGAAEGGADPHSFSIALPCSQWTSHPASHPISAGARHQSASQLSLRVSMLAGPHLLA